MGLQDGYYQTRAGEHEATILQNIWPLLEGKTVIVVTHRVAALEGLVDEIIALSRGRIASRLASDEFDLLEAQLEPQPASY
jgi:ABC-type bacteriocin/lantibiotic exporter with double-glycine peptidase domain